MIGASSYVRCSKVGVVEDPEVPTSEGDDYEFGGFNPNTSVPVDYWVTGELRRDPEIGKPLWIDRDCRNGVKIPGQFMTSPVVSLEVVGEKLRVDTRNSTYILEVKSS